MRATAKTTLAGGVALLAACGLEGVVASRPRPGCALARRADGSREGDVSGGGLEDGCRFDGDGAANAQVHFLDVVRAAGGIAAVVRSPEEAAALFSMEPTT